MSHFYIITNNGTLTGYIMHIQICVSFEDQKDSRDKLMYHVSFPCAK